MNFIIIFMWSTLLFSAVLCNCESLSREEKQRPTSHLKNTIEFYYTTLKLEEKVDSILLQLNGEHSNYQETFQKPVMDLTASLYIIAGELEKFKAQYKGDNFPVNEYNIFMASINEKFLETRVLSKDIMPKLSEGMEKIEEDKNGLFKEISKFLTKRLEFEKHIVQLEEFGILLHDPSETEAFDISFLNNLYEKLQTDDETLPKVEKLSLLENDSALPNIDGKKLGNFVPTVNEVVGRIQEKIELIGEKYDEIFSRWLTTAEGVTLAEQKIMDLREQLKRNFITNTRNEF